MLAKSFVFPNKQFAGKKKLDRMLMVEITNLWSFNDFEESVKTSCNLYTNGRAAPAFFFNRYASIVHF